MSFWSAEKILRNARNIIEPFDQQNIESAAYILHLGEEVFITQDTTKLVPKDRYTPQRLTDEPPGNTVSIEPGQFAFLLTQEVVRIPLNAIAFISMKASYKFKGLINVSGFHVDPGFDGKLKFGVYNAGPQPIILSKGIGLFQIFFADLDGRTEKGYSGRTFKANNIDSNLIQGMTGQVFSPIFLQTKINSLEEKQRLLETKITKITTGAGVIAVIAGLIFAGLKIFK